MARAAISRASIDPLFVLFSFPDSCFPFLFSSTLVQYNLFREIGVWEKQSSAYMQAKAAQTTLRCSALPRARAPNLALLPPSSVRGCAMHLSCVSLPLVGTRPFLFAWQAPLVA